MAQVEELNRDFIRSHRAPKDERQTAHQLPRTQVPDRFFEELRSLAQPGHCEAHLAKAPLAHSDTANRIHGGSIQGRIYITHFIQHAAVNTRQWDYPCVKLASIEQDEQGTYVAGELDWKQTAPGLLERWVLFRSGQFVHSRAIQEPPGHENEVHYLGILRLMSEVYEFAKRMAREGVISPTAVVKVALRKGSGLGLLVPDSFEIGKGSPHWCKQDAIDDLRH